MAKTVGERNLQGADKIVQKVLEIIRYFQPDHWRIENPRTGLLKNRTFMQGLPFVDVDYCQYSMWGYRKPTRFWGSEEIVSRGGKICDLQTCPNSEISADGRKRHKRVLGGNENQVCTKLKGRVPAALIDHLLGRENDAPPRPPEILSGPWQTRPNPKGEGTSLKEVKVLPRMMMDVGIFQAGQIKKCGNALQLLMEIQTELPNRQLQVLDMLVDTGAEANIVKLGKLPRHLVYAAPKPLKFVTARGQRLRGGDTCIDLHLEFVQEVDGKFLPDVLRKKVTFFEADIRVDAILSYPWMAQNQIGVFPHLKAMALEKPKLTLLHGLLHGKNGN